MTENSRRTLEAAFQEWLELSRLEQGSAEVEDFLAGQPAALRSALRQRISDHRALLESAASAPPQLEAGHEIDDYRLIRELGRGGMGAVWEAEQISLKRRVALKILNPSLSFSPTALQRFRREAEAGGRLQHPGIVQTYAVGESSGLHWIAQELVADGFSLADLLAEQRQQLELPADGYQQIAEFFIRVADAMEQAHQAKVVHRDIKPNNILVDSAGNPRIADFGLAKVQDDLGLSRTGDFAGTPFYMSPEQALAKRLDLDHRTDIFSLGATLYEALTLVRAFDGDTSQQVFQKILMDDPVDPRRFRSRIPRDLAVICMKCLEKKAEHRYPSMADLAADLRRYLDHEAIHARPPGAVARSMKWCRRHQVLAASATLFGIAFLVVSGLLLHIGKLARDAEAVAYPARVRKAHALLASGLVQEARSVLQACPEPLRNWEWGWLSARAEPEYPALAGGLVEFEAMAISSDGNTIVTGTEAGSVALWDAWTGAPLAEFIGHVGSIRSAQFNPQGTRVVTTSSDQTTRVWDSRSGDFLFQFGREKETSAFAVYSPDGLKIASVNESSRNSKAWLWDAPTGSFLVELSGHEDRIQTLAFNPQGDRIVTAGQDGSARIWDAATGTELAVLQDHTAAVESAVFSPDGHQVLTASADHSARLWNARTGEPIRTFQGHLETVRSAAFSPDGNQVVTTSSDGSVRVWNAVTGESVALIPVQETGPYFALFGDDGLKIVIALWDGPALVWDVKNEGFLLDRGPPAQTVRSAFLNPQGCRLLTGAETAERHVQDGWGAGVRFDVPSFNAIALSPRGDRALASEFWYSDDQRSRRPLRLTRGQDPHAFTARVLDPISGLSLSVLRGHLNLINAASFSSDGNRIVTGSDDHTARVWQPDTGKLLLVLKGHEKAVTTVSFSPDQRRILTGSEDHTARLWHAETGQELMTFGGHEDSVLGVVFSPDGGRIATVSDDGRLQLWDADTGERMWQLPDAVDSPGSLGFDPEGRRLVFAARGGAVQIHDVENGKRLLFLQGHQDDVSTTRFSPSGRRILSGSNDGTARCWDANSGDLIWVLRANANWLDDALFSHDESRIVTAAFGGMADGEIAVWSSSSGEFLTSLTPIENGWLRGLSAEDCDVFTNDFLYHNRPYRDRVEDIQALRDQMAAFRPEFLERLEKGSDLVELRRSHLDNRSLSTVQVRAGLALLQFWDDHPHKLLQLLEAAGLQETVLNPARAFALARCIGLSGNWSAARRLEAHGLALAAQSGIEVRQNLGMWEGASLLELERAAWLWMKPVHPDMQPDLDLALRLARAGVALAPDRCGIRNTLAWVHFARGENDQALAEAQKALDFSVGNQRYDMQHALSNLRKEIALVQGPGD